MNGCLRKMANDLGLSSYDELTKEIHIYPDFHGNRSPLADPNLRGMVRSFFQNDHLRVSFF